MNEYTYPVEVCVYLSKTKVHRDTQHTRVPHIIMSTQKKKLFEFLKYNNICSLTAILNEQFPNYAGYPKNMHTFEER